MWLRESRQFVTAGLLIVAAVAAVAQDRPDFSGRWVLIEPASAGADVPRAMSVQQWLVRTNVRGEPMTPYFKDITISREFDTRTGTDTYAIGIIGGVGPGVRADGSQNGPRGRYAVKWEAETLVFESGTHTPEAFGAKAWSERRERWQLEPDGNLRVTISTRSSDAATGTFTLLYQRKESRLLFRALQ